MYDSARAKYEFATLTESLRRILETKQDDDEGLVEYTKRYKQAKDIVKDFIGTELLHNFVETTAEFQAAADNAAKTKLKKESFDKWTSYMYLYNSDQKKYGSLMKNFKTQYSLGNNQYCETITAAADVLTNHTWDATYKESVKKRRQQKAEANNKNDKVKEEQLHAQGKGKDFKPTCYCCGGEHKVTECDKRDKIPKNEWAVNKGMSMYTKSKSNKAADNKEENNNKDNNWSGTKVQGMQVHHCMLQKEYDALNFGTSLVLDTGSTFSSVHNKNLITNIKEATKPIMMKTNTGKRLIKEEGTIDGFNKQIWYDPEAAVNIFGFKDVKEQYRITYDSKQEDAFNIHLDDNNKVKFKASSEGLYY